MTQGNLNITNGIHAQLILKPGKEKSVWRRHPWIFSGAVAKIQGHPGLGDFVGVYSDKQQFLGWAAYNPKSQIRARIWSFQQTESINPGWLRQKIQYAINKRKLLNNATNAMRLIHGEADGLPGVICDQYGSWLVLQFNSAGAQALKAECINQLVECTGIAKVYERTDSDTLHLEGLQVQIGPLTDAAKQAIEQAQMVPIVENQIQYIVDLVAGHKTGFYLDQRDNRALVHNLARGRVLNCFSYTGGFSLAALKGGCVEVISIDSSEPAMLLARDHARKNKLESTQSKWIVSDVFQYLRQAKAAGELFDLIILDPPKFAPNASSLDRACRAYKDVNLIAMQLLKPGGHLLTFSCSGVMTAELFRKVIAGAAADSKVDFHVVNTLRAGLDHPVALWFPEGEYLKGLHLQRV